MNLENHPAGIIRKAAERRRLNGLVPEGFVKVEPQGEPEPEQEPQDEPKPGPSRPPRKGKAAWAAKLIRGEKGPRPFEANVAIALRMDAAFVGRLRLNEMSEA